MNKDLTVKQSSGATKSRRRISYTEWSKRFVGAHTITRDGESQWTDSSWALGTQSASLPPIPSFALPLSPPLSISPPLESSSSSLPSSPSSSPSPLASPEKKRPRTDIDLSPLDFQLLKDIMKNIQIAENTKSFYTDHIPSYRTTPIPVYETEPVASPPIYEPTIITKGYQTSQKTSIKASSDEIGYDPANPSMAIGQSRPVNVPTTAFELKMFDNIKMPIVTSQMSHSLRFWLAQKMIRDQLQKGRRPNVQLYYEYFDIDQSTVLEINQHEEAKDYKYLSPDECNQENLAKLVVKYGSKKSRQNMQTRKRGRSVHYSQKRQNSDRF